MAKQRNTSDGDAGDDSLDARVARAELQARYYEAQIRVFEARRKLAELRRDSKAGN